MIPRSEGLEVLDSGKRENSRALLPFPMVGGGASEPGSPAPQPDNGWWAAQVSPCSGMPRVIMVSGALYSVPTPLTRGTAL